MTLHREAITDQMARCAKVVFDGLDPEYYLGGGTALALQIGHRTSVDLDYFIAKEIDTGRLRRELVRLCGPASIEIVFEEKNTLWCRMDGVKVSFLSRFDPLLEHVIVSDPFRFAGMDDITVMKLSALCGREEYKDYFDLACVAQDADVRGWLSLWSRAYPTSDPTSWIVALGAVDQVPPIPLRALSAYARINVSAVLRSAVVDLTKYLSALS